VDSREFVDIINNVTEIQEKKEKEIQLKHKADVLYSTKLDPESSLIEAKKVS
jgi:hypothetical protein